MTSEEIKKKILESFPQAEVDVAGQGDRFNVSVKAEKLDDLSLVKKHQSILALFKTEFSSGKLHALNLNFPSKG